MRATQVLANLRVADVEASKSFYTDFLGLSTQEFNMGWVARYTSPDGRASVQLVTRDASAPEDSVISVISVTSKVPTQKLKNAVLRSCTR